MSKPSQVARYSLPVVVDPASTICYKISVPNDKFHIAAFKGQLWALARAYAWANDDAHTARDVALVWRRIYDNLRLCEQPLPMGGAEGGDENMIRQNPDNPCELQTSIDGTNWCTFADLSKCFPNVQQPGDGAEQPAAGGGNVCYKAIMPASDYWLVPTVVSAGDIVEITNATGAGSDGSALVWDCPDGNNFFAGACIGGTGHTDSGDPLNTVNHMRLIVFIDGTAHDGMAGPITVPSGVSNGIVTIQVNDSDLSDNSGSYQFDVCVTNNAATTWTHVFDFTLSNGGWAALTGWPGGAAIGNWVAGVGWQPSFVADDGAGHSERRLRIDILFSARDLTEMTALYDASFGTTIDTSAGQNFGSIDGGVHTAFQDTTWGSPSGTNILGGGAHVHAAQTHLWFDFFLSEANAPTDAGGSLTLKRITVSGIGTDPF